jgi:hypothetical protein
VLRRFGLLAPLLAVALTLPVVRGTARAHAQGVGITYHAGWNIVAGPDGTQLPDSTKLYALGPGDLGFVTLPPQGPIAGGRGYWAYFPADSTVTLAGTGTSTAQVPAPAGQYILIGNPSGTQSAIVSGADDVEVWDPVAAIFQASTTLGVGQGGWAMSRAGGAITITGTGPALSAPAPAPAVPPSTSASSAPPVASATPAPAPKLGVSISIDSKNSTASGSAPGDLVFEVDVTLAGQPAPGASLSGALTITGLPQGALAPVPFGPDDLAANTGEIIKVSLPPLAVNARVLIHAAVTLNGQTATTDAVYTVSH